MPKLRNIKTTKYLKFLEAIGCKHIRTKGSHAIYKKKELRRPLVIPLKREVSPGVIRSNLRTLGMDVEEFLEILKKVR